MVKLDNQPSLEEAQWGVDSLNIGKAKGRDGLFSEIFHYGGKYVIQLMHDFLKISMP